MDSSPASSKGADDGQASFREYKADRGDGSCAAHQRRTAADRISTRQLDRCSVCCGTPGATGTGGGLLEGLDIHPQLSLRAQHELLPFAYQVAGAFIRIESPAGGVEGLAQVGRGRPPGRAGPQEIHRLLSVHAMAGSQGQELHQGGRLPQAPGVFGDGPGTHANPKPTEQPYPDRLPPSKPEGSILYPLGGSVSLHPCTFSYKIGARANESPMCRSAVSVAITLA